MRNIDHFIPTNYSNNKIKFLHRDIEDDIIIGGTTIHIFKVKFKFSERVASSRIIYKQGMKIILEIPQENYTDIKETNFGTTITVKLTPEQTSQFNWYLLDTSVQLEITTLDGDIFYNAPSPLKVIKPLTMPSCFDGESSGEGEIGSSGITGLIGMGNPFADVSNEETSGE